MRLGEMCRYKFLNCQLQTSKCLLGTFAAIKSNRKKNYFSSFVQSVLR